MVNGINLNQSKKIKVKFFTILIFFNLIYSSQVIAEIFHIQCLYEKGKKNITINSVSPGFILSEMTNKISEDHTELLKSRISLNKFGKPEDVANTVIFLSSNLADYITGETIHVNGGMYFS